MKLVDLNKHNQEGDKKPSLLSKTGQFFKEAADTGLHTVGFGGAYLRQVPVLGAATVGTVAYVGRKIEEGYKVGRMVIALKQLAKGEITPEVAAKMNLTQAEIDKIRVSAGLPPIQVAMKDMTPDQAAKLGLAPA